MVIHTYPLSPTSSMFWSCKKNAILCSFRLLLVLHFARQAVCGHKFLSAENWCYASTSCDLRKSKMIDTPQRSCESTAARRIQYFAFAESLVHPTPVLHWHNVKCSIYSIYMVELNKAFIMVCFRLLSLIGPPWVLEKPSKEPFARVVLGSVVAVYLTTDISS